MPSENNLHDEPRPLRLEQCDAVRRIRDRFGTEKALGYLIGEKFAGFTRAADHDPSLAVAVPDFARVIRSIFTPSELRAYLQRVPRLGPLGHVATNEEVREFEAAGIIEEESLDDQLQALIRIERMKKLLL